MKDIASKIKLKTNNFHLKDIFSDECYLELGNIHYGVIDRLLKKELVALDDIACFPIQNKGLGHSEINKEYDVKDQLPFLFYKNFNQKHLDKQIVITYGLLHYRGADKREVFMPIILLPVNMYEVDKKMFFQLIARPFVNPFFYSVFNDANRVKFLANDKLETIFALDNYVLTVKKVLNLEVKLENYLTYASIKKDDVIIDYKRFTRLSIKEHTLTRLFTEKKLYYSHLLNKTQRKVIERSLNGQNLIMSGPIGTGKSTALMNIAANFMMNNKRVLYVSNSQTSIDDIEHFFDSKGLGNYVANFTKPFSSLLEPTHDLTLVNSVDVSEKLAELNEKYQYIDTYEEAIGKRINDFYFHEVIEELALLADVDTGNIDYDDASHIHRGEYNKIIKALNIITKNIAKLPEFNVKCLNDSTWKIIPLINQLQHSNQIISLITQIYTTFQRLNDRIKELEKEYSFKSIPNFASTRRLMHNMEVFNYELIPSSWVEYSDRNYNEAEYEYSRLNSIVFHINEVEYYLSNIYQNLDTINIQDEIKTIFSKYYTFDDQELIDHINENHGDLLLRMNRAQSFRATFLKKYKALSSRFNWNFLEEDEHLDQMLKLIDFLTTVEINDTVIHMAQLADARQIVGYVEKISNDITKLEKENKAFYDKYEISPELEASILALDVAPNKKLTAYLRKTFPKIDISQLSAEIKKKNDNITSIKKYRDQCSNYTKMPYENTDKYIFSMNSTINYLSSITDIEIKKRIIDILSNDILQLKKRKEKYQDFLKDLVVFKTAYSELEAFIISFNKYRLFDTTTSFKKKLAQIVEVVAYIEQVFASNQKMQKVVINPEHDYVTVAEYYKMQDLLLTYDNLINELKIDDRFPRFFEKLYNYENTDMSVLKKALSMYSIYKGNFQSNKAAVQSFKHQIKIKTILNECKELANTIDSCFKLYCGIFKDGVSSYFYSSYETVLKTFNKLVNSKNELVVYLNITAELTLLQKLKLPKLIDFIAKCTDSSIIIPDFKKVYFTKLYDLLICDNEIIKDSAKYVEALQEVVELEKELLVLNEINCISDITKVLGQRINTRKISNLDYQKYLTRSFPVKKLILSNTVILDNFFENIFEDFDLVIVDDAELLDANEYTAALSGKQVIVCGEYKVRTSSDNDLLSKMRRDAIIDFDYRFDEIPHRYLQFIPRLKSRISNDYQENFAIEVIKEDYVQYIFDLFNLDRTAKINCYVEDFVKQRKIYETLIHLFLKNDFTSKEAQAALCENINITSLYGGSSIAADYNVIDLNDYSFISIDNEGYNLAIEVLSCKKKAIIYDPNDWLNYNPLPQSLGKLKQAVLKTDVFKNEIDNELTCVLVNELEKKGCKVYNSHNSLSLYIEYKDQLYGLLLLWDRKNTSEIINTYRDYTNSKMKIITINKYDMIKGIRETANKIFKENFK